MGTTATIRVPTETRDAFAEIATELGLSVAGLLAQIAEREHLHLIYAVERKATAVDLDDPDASAEYSLWDESEFDGVD